MNIRSVSKLDNSTFTAKVDPRAVVHAIAEEAAEDRGRGKSITGLYIRRGLSNTLLKNLPNITISDETAQKIDKFCEWCNKPHINRAIMGAFAILTQPFIDMKNDKVDEDTANISAIRTASKIVAGTVIGIGIRSACYKVSDYLTKKEPPNAPPRNALEKAVRPLRGIMAPPNNVIRALKAFGPFNRKNYCSMISTGIGFAVMLITNPMLDVPITNFFSKVCVKAYKTRKEKNNNPSGGNIPNQPPVQTTPPVINPTPTSGTTPTKDINQVFRDVFSGGQGLSQKGGIS